MKYEEIDQKDRDMIGGVLVNHLELGVRTILEKDKCLLPMLAIFGKEQKIIGLQPESGKTDVDIALNVAVDVLKKEDFDNAIFSYSTKIGSTDEKLAKDAIKTFVILKSGVTVVFFTIYKISGLFKKKAEYLQTLTASVIENIFK